MECRADLVGCVLEQQRRRILAADELLETVKQVGRSVERGRTSQLGSDTCGRTCGRPRITHRSMCLTHQGLQGGPDEAVPSYFCFNCEENISEDSTALSCNAEGCDEWSCRPCLRLPRGLTERQIKALAIRCPDHSRQVHDITRVRFLSLRPYL